MCFPLLEQEGRRKGEGAAVPYIFGRTGGREREGGVGLRSVLFTYLRLGHQRGMGPGEGGRESQVTRGGSSLAPHKPHTHKTQISKCNTKPLLFALFTTNTGDQREFSCGK